MCVLGDLCTQGFVNEPEGCYVYFQTFAGENHASEYVTNLMANHRFRVSIQVLREGLRITISIPTLKSKDACLKFDETPSNGARDIPVFPK